VIFKKAV